MSEAGTPKVGDPNDPSVDGQSCSYRIAAAGIGMVPGVLLWTTSWLPSRDSRTLAPRIVASLLLGLVPVGVLLIVDDLFWDKVYGAPELAWFVYFAVAISLVVFLGGVFWDAIVRLDEVTDHVLNTDLNRRNALSFARRTLRLWPQILFSLGFAATGLLALWILDRDIEPEELEFGFASYGAVALLSFVGANGLYAGFLVPLLNRKIFEPADLDLYNFAPAWTPAVVKWSRLFVRFALNAIPFFVVVGVPITFAVSEALQNESDAAPFVAVFAFLVGAIGAGWMAFLPHHWMRRCVVDRKLKQIGERQPDIDRLLATAADSRADAERLEVQLSIVEQLDSSPNSPVQWAARAASAVGLAILPTLLSLGIALLFGQSIGA